jgi:hypothetical protein
MPSLRNCRWQRDSRKPASGKPGAVQDADEELFGKRRGDARDDFG